MTDRIESIRKLLAKDPQDVFLNYSLGMECAAAGSVDDALAAFARCVQTDPGYLAAYVEAGKCARDAGRTEQARVLLAQALELAETAGQTHTADMVRQQLRGL